MGVSREPAWPERREYTEGGICTHVDTTDVARKVSRTASISVSFSGICLLRSLCSHGSFEAAHVSGGGMKGWERRRGWGEEGCCAMVV